MPRSVRIQYAGAIYHVMCRGDHREEIFRDASDRDLFLKTLAEVSERSGFRIHSYVMMSNHYHLLLETPEPNLVDGMRWFQGTYTARFNAKHKVSGHLFQGRYKAIPVQSEDPEYFRVVSDYIHLNPARARLIGTNPPNLKSYAWSSFPLFIGKRKLPGWLIRDRVFDVHGWSGEEIKEKRRYMNYLCERAAMVVSGKDKREDKEEWSVVKKGWYIGGKEFKERLEKMAAALVTRKRRESYVSEGLRLHDEKEAERLLMLALEKLGLTLEDVKERKYNDASKQGILWFLRTKTVVKGLWLCDRLNTGHESNLSRAMKAYQNPGDRQRTRLKKELMQVCKD